MRIVPLPVGHDDAHLSHPFSAPKYAVRQVPAGPRRGPRPQRCAPDRDDASIFPACSRTAAKTRRVAGHWRCGQDGREGRTPSPLPAATSTAGDAAQRRFRYLGRGLSLPQSEHPATSNTAGHRPSHPTARPPRQGPPRRLHRAPTWWPPLGRPRTLRRLYQIRDELLGSRRQAPWPVGPWCGDRRGPRRRRPRRGGDRRCGRPCPPWPACDAGAVVHHALFRGWVVAAPGRRCAPGLPGFRSSASYTVQSAWVGDIRAARNAGSRPARAPMSRAAASPPAQARVGMTVAQCLVWA
jgi:hypothetical protein